MKCVNCGNINDEDAVFCKICGLNLEVDSTKEITRNDNNVNEKKNKNKAKTKTKIKKVKVKDKKRQKKEKRKENKKDQKNDKNVGQNLLTLFLFIICIILLGALSILIYYLYSIQNIVVPNVTSMTYNEAETTLKELGLNIEKNLEETENVEEENIVLSQNKKEGRKVSKGTVIKVKVGKYKKVYYLDDFTNMNIESAKSILSLNNLKYSIIYKESESENNIIIFQKPKANTKMKDNQTVILTVSKKTKDSENNEDKDNKSTEDAEENSENQEENNETED